VWGWLVGGDRGPSLGPSPAGDRDGTCAFAVTAWLPERQARQLAGAIGQLEQEIARWAAPEFRHLACRIAHELAGALVGGSVALGKEAVLDVVAELVELAEDVHAQGRYATAFALEGIAGRLIEALVAPEAAAGASRRTGTADG